MTFRIHYTLLFPTLCDASEGQLRHKQGRSIFYCDNVRINLTTGQGYAAREKPLWIARAASRLWTGSGEGGNLLMKVLIIGAAGMTGRKLTARLARGGRLAGTMIDHAHLIDIVTPQPFANPPSRSRSTRSTSPRLTLRQSWPRRGRTSFSCSPPWSPARQRRIRTRATPLMAAEPSLCSRRSGAGKNLGFRADANFSAIIHAYMKDELKT
jgi:hypothetical protein